MTREQRTIRDILLERGYILHGPWGINWEGPDRDVSYRVYLTVTALMGKYIKKGFVEKTPDGWQLTKLGSESL